MQLTLARGWGRVGRKGVYKRKHKARDATDFTLQFVRYTMKLLGEDGGFRGTSHKVLLCITGLAASAILPGYNYPTHGDASSSYEQTGHSSGLTISHDDSSGTFGQGLSSGTVVSHGSSSDVTFGQVSHGTSFAHGTTSGDSLRDSSLGSTSGSFVNIGSVSGTAGLAPCGGDQVRHVDGRCVTPRVNRRVFLYDVPANVQTTGAVDIPEPRVNTNILLIRTPEGGLGPQPIVVPPPRQNHVVYVLNKQSSHGPGVIEVPSSPLEDPEVYFVNYAEGENPILSNGQDLQSALQSANQAAGQTIGSVGQTGSVGGQVFDDHSSSVGISQIVSDVGHSRSSDNEFIGSSQFISTGGQSSNTGGQIFGSGDETRAAGGDFHGSDSQTGETLFITGSIVQDDVNSISPSSIYSLP
ncbi:uncharacterized protein LOC122242300 [Penaeus japonicus]|uniref:uncharacterized protein LOC122242300 n=1 Tax=Penaeus japonicus TaxID=27405 RepID=UPI001C7151B5|nr:uncharacterized protein LOC122242300 [Penaeus japonicus]